MTLDTGTRVPGCASFTGSRNKLRASEDEAWFVFYVSLCIENNEKVEFMGSPYILLSFRPYLALFLLSVRVVRQLLDIRVVESAA